MSARNHLEHITLLGIALGFALSCGGSTDPSDNYDPTVPARIVLAADTMSIYPGETWRTDLPLAKVYNSRNQLLVTQPMWASTDDAIARVFGERVQGVAEGQTTVIASAGSVTASVRVTIIHEPVASVHGDLASPTYLYGADSIVLKSYASGPLGDSLPGRVVAITARQPAIATITPAGMIHVLSSGTAYFYFESEGISDSVSVIADARRVARLVIEPNSVQLVMNHPSPTLTCHILDASNNDLGSRPIAWSSSDVGIVAVGECSVFPDGVGSAFITGRVDTTSAQVTVTVVPSP
jgi:hypothetical protein